MPPAGGSQAHPHLSVLGQFLPTPLEEKVFSASKRYQELNGSIFWKALIEKEKASHERYLADIGQTSWMVNFISHGWLFEIMAVFRERLTILDLAKQDFTDFADGLRRVFLYMHSKGIYSFNLNIYSGTQETGEHFWTHARIVPRFVYSPIEASDTAVGRILHDWCFAFWNPEEVCTELKSYFSKD